MIGVVLVFVTDLYLGSHDDISGDDHLRAEFMCPFCAEDYDVVGLCCHIDEEHRVEADNGVSSFSISNFRTFTCFYYRSSFILSFLLILIIYFALRQACLSLCACYFTSDHSWWKRKSVGRNI